jgi:hypothetical protein
MIDQPINIASIITNTRKTMQMTKQTTTNYSAIITDDQVIVMNEKNIIVGFWNINTDRRCESGYAKTYFEHFKLDKRRDEIIAEILKYNFNVISLCEIDANNIDWIVNQLKSAGYDCVFGAYSPNQVPDVSFYHFTAWKNCKLLDSHMFWFTSTPLVGLTSETRPIDPVLKSCNEEYEKGSLVTVLETNGQVLINVVIHWGLREAYQTVCSNLLVNHLDELCEKYQACNIPVVVVMGGDFNSLPGIDERPFDPILKKGYYKHIGGDRYTFVGYPYDLGLKGGRQLPTVLEKCVADPANATKYFVDTIYETNDGPIIGSLDNVFTRGIDNATCKIVTADFDPRNMTKEEYIKAINTKRPLSDHALVIFEF